MLCERQRWLHGWNPRMSPSPLIKCEVSLSKDLHCKTMEKSTSSFFTPLGGATPLRSHPLHIITPTLSLHPLLGEIRITRECSEDYQIDITDGLFFPCLLHGLSLHFPLLLESVTHSFSCSPWLICVFTLCPSSSLTAPGYVWMEKHLMNRSTWKERDRGL